MTESENEQSPKAAAAEEGGLLQKLDHLEDYWVSRKAQLKARKSTLRPKQSPPSSSSSSSSGQNRNRGALSMVESSPPSLTASLQLGVGSAPATGRWKVRTNDLAVEEVLKERRAAIVEGRVKGRRLFHDDQQETEDDDVADFVDWYGSHPDIGGYQDDQKGPEEEGFSPDSSSSSSSFVCDECLKKAAVDVVGREDREDTTAAATTLDLVPAKHVNPEKRLSPPSSLIAVSRGRRWKVLLMACLAIGFVVVAEFFIDGYSNRDLVPT